MKNDLKISKPTNRPTTIRIQLLSWRTHLELAAGPEDDFEAGSQRTQSSGTIQLKINKQIIIHLLNQNKMKSKNQILKGLALLFVLVMITIGAKAQVGTLTQTGAHTVCLNSNESYGVINNPGSIYTWSIIPASGGSITGNSNTISVHWTTVGSYTLQVIERNSLGCDGDPIPIPITVNPLPTATIAGTTSVCQNGTAPNITFTGADGTAPYTFTYTLNGGAPQTVVTTSGNSVTVSAPTTTAGTFTYDLTGVQDASGTTCSQNQTGSAVITVNPLPLPTITGPTPICATTTSNVYTTETGMTNYVWTVSAGGLITSGGTATDNTVTVTWNTSGTQIVSINYTNGTSCTATNPTTYNVTVDPLPITSQIYHN